jgi:hypothetical protein
MGTKEKTPIRGDQVFVIRVWREPGETVDDDDSWRGQVSHDNGRRGFVGLPRLFALIRQILSGSCSSTSRPPRRDA